jgi:threonine/homoserine/homoserine lactone efflux protein
VIALTTIFTTSFVIAFSGAMMPGPLLSITISESPKRGLWTGPLLIAGHGILEMALIVALLLGLAPFLNRPEVFVGTALGGTLVLLWMAWGMLRALPHLTLNEDPGAQKGRNLMLSGLLLSIANPYWTIWWVSIGLGYILHSMTYGKWGVVAFFSGHILADLLWYTAISTALWRGKQFLSDRVYRCLIGACALFLIVFALLFARAGLKQLLPALNLI